MDGQILPARTFLFYYAFEKYDSRWMMDISIGNEGEGCHLAGAKSSVLSLAKFRVGPKESS